MEFQEGQRIQYGDGCLATVRYVGPVATSKKLETIWLGVEWDEQGRGKHDGSVALDDGSVVRYFSCEDQQGSFLKEKKVSAGLSIQEALSERYVSMDAPLIAPDSVLPGAFVNTSKGNQKPILLLGEEKIRKWQQRDDVVKVTLRREGIASLLSRAEVGAEGVEDLGKEGEGEEVTFDRITHLDLQENLLWRWDEVVEIGTHCVSLKTLDLSGNLFWQASESPLSSIILPGSPSPFQQLQTIVLNHCSLDHRAFFDLLTPSLFPSLEELYFAMNDLSVVNITDLGDLVSMARCREEEEGGGGGSSRARLRVLDVSECQIEHFQTFMGLMAHITPSLSSLVLNQNAIRSLAYDVSVEPEDDNNNNGKEDQEDQEDQDEELELMEEVDEVAKEETNPLSSLRLSYMSLSRTLIDSWQDINQLTVFEPQALRLSHIPLFSDFSASECRTIIIGKVPSLKQLNGTLISEKERAECEKAYLRTILKESRDLYEQDPQAFHHEEEEEEDREAGGSHQTMPFNQFELLTRAVNAFPSLLDLHPHLPLLMARYGESLLTMSSRAANSSSAISSDLVEVTINCYGASGLDSADAVDGAVRKRVPRSMPVARFKLLLSHLFKIPPEHQLITHLPPTAPGEERVPYPIDDDRSTLEWFNIVDGSQIQLNEIDV